MEDPAKISIQSPTGKDVRIWVFDDQYIERDSQTWKRRFDLSEIHRIVSNEQPLGMGSIILISSSTTRQRTVDRMKFIRCAEYAEEQVRKGGDEELLRVSEILQNMLRQQPDVLLNERVNPIRSRGKGGRIGKEGPYWLRETEGKGQSRKGKNKEGEKAKVKKGMGEPIHNATQA